MEDDRPTPNASLRFEYLLERVNRLESDLFDLQHRVDRLTQQEEDMRRLLEQSIRVVEYLQKLRLQDPEDANSGFEQPSER
ncbi:MAG TPA: hypothetical protein VF201_16150 [Nitrolancea sp.]